MLTLIKAGLSSIQDAGRFGFEALGIGHAGFADPHSASVANLLVGNKPESACIEICESHFEIATDAPIQIACFGAWASLSIGSEANDRRQIYPGCAFWLAQGETLRIYRWFAGRTLYLATASALDLPEVMRSLSTDSANHFGGRAGRMLKNSDVLPVMAAKPAPQQSLLHAWPIPLTSKAVQGAHLLRFLPFQAALAAQLNQRRYQLTSQCSRAALRLQGPALQIEPALSSALSAGVVPGAIQVLPSGEPLVLGIDAQTLGGYALAGCVISADLAKLAQLKIGEVVRFECVDWLQAQQLNLARERLQERQVLAIDSSN
jgi:5-oxoprolinase (ATP-hydrolysing) subunit C